MGIRALIVLHWRIWFALAVGLAMAFLLPSQWAPLTRALTCWNATVLVLIPLIFLHLGGLSARELRARYRSDDPTAPVILLLVVIAAILSVAAIVVFLPSLKNGPDTERVAHVVLATLTICASWLLVPTIFTVHYADMFYSEEESRQPLEFPHTPEPVFWDFAYFSFTIAAACQTADVSTTQTAIRRVVVAQSIISFVFNLAILGFAINVTAGLLS